MNIEKAYPLGTRAASGEMEHYLGFFGRFKHQDPDATSSLARVLSEMDVCARWVKNESGGTLAAGTIVTWDTGATYGPFRAVGAAAAAGTNVGIGAVDPFVSGAVANDDHFWLITNGPCQFLFTTGTTIAVGDLLTLGASGRVNKYDPASADAEDNLCRCGRVMEAVNTAVASGTLFDGFADFRA